MFFRVNTRVKNGGNDREVFFIMEADFPDLKSVHEALVRDRFLFGIRLNTKNIAPHKRVIEDEAEEIVSAESIVSIMSMRDDLFEEDGTQVYSIDEADRAEAST